jgi:DNA-binding GntR family transcriptional regulator
MREEAYQELRRLILEGELVPGERLRDQEIAAWLAVSRTPVREALTRLADEALVEMAPNRYTRVRPIDPSDAEGYAIAAALHGLATRQAASVGTFAPVARGRLADAAERYAWARLREDANDLIAADDDLHAIVVELAGNAVLGAQLDRLVPRLRRLEAALGTALATNRPDEHDTLLNALEQGDGIGAARLVEAEWLALGEMVRRELRLVGRAAP